MKPIMLFFAMFILLLDVYLLFNLRQSLTTGFIVASLGGLGCGLLAYALNGGNEGK